LLLWQQSEPFFQSVPFANPRGSGNVVSNLLCHTERSEVSVTLSHGS
jgi:hypothetical protein